MNQPNSLVEYLSALYVKAGGDPRKAEEWIKASRSFGSPLEERFYSALRYSLKSPMGLSVEPQFRVGIYRLDFLCTLGNVKVGVEVDGHDFHEKTKAQARHDKSRDRFILSQGISVLHFTGSEVFNDPEDCAEEVFNLLKGDKMSAKA